MADEQALHEALERDAYAEFWAAAPAAARAAYGVAHHRIGDGVLLTAPGLDGSLLFNRLTGYGIAGARAEDLDDAIRALTESGVRTWAIQAAPAATGLAELAAARGLVPHPRLWAKFVRGTEPAPAGGLPVRRAGPSDARAFGEVFRTAFGLPGEFAPWAAALVGRPGWHCFVAWHGGEPVGIGALFVRDGLGWLGLGGTLPGHRGLGGQTAMLAARIAAGVAEGCRAFSTETGVPLPGESGPSFRNILKAGFREAYRRPNLVPATAGNQREA